MFKKASALTVLLAGSIASAFAAVPTEVTSAMSDMKTDGLAVASAFLVAFIAISAFAMMRRGVKG